MLFAVSAALTYRFAAPCDVLLLLEAARRADQRILCERLELPTGTLAVRKDGPTGERGVVFAAHGEMTFAYTAEVEVTRRESQLTGIDALPIRELPAETLAFLRPSRYCPADTFEGFSKRTFGDQDGGAKVAAIVAWVRGHVEYRAGVSSSRSTACDTFMDRAGVCRDFTHLTISLCRAADIPARAVSAYAWTLEPPDMHAVVEVYLDGGWRLIDPTGLAPETGLVRVATGRDAADIAFMTIFGEAELVHQTFEVASLGTPASSDTPPGSVQLAASDG